MQINIIKKISNSMGNNTLSLSKACWVRQLQIQSIITSKASNFSHFLRRSNENRNRVRIIIETRNTVGFQVHIKVYQTILMIAMLRQDHQKRQISSQGLWIQNNTRMTWLR